MLLMHQNPHRTESTKAISSWRREALSQGEPYSLPAGEQESYICEGFHKWWYPKMDGLQWKIIKKNGYH